MQGTETGTVTRSGAAQIRDILARLMDETERAFEEMEGIATRESESAPEGSPKHDKWAGFGNFLFSDTMVAHRAIHHQIAALRGALIYRGLDDSQPEYQPPSEEPDEADDLSEVEEPEE